MSQCPTDKLEEISWKESRLLSGLGNLMRMVTIKAEVIELGENLGGGMMYEVEKPSCRKAVSSFV